MNDTTTQQEGGLRVTVAGDLGEKRAGYVAERCDAVHDAAGRVANPHSFAVYDAISAIAQLSAQCCLGDASEVFETQLQLGMVLNDAVNAVAQEACDSRRDVRELERLAVRPQRLAEAITAAKVREHLATRARLAAYEAATGECDPTPEQDAAIRAAEEAEGKAEEVVNEAADELRYNAGDLFERILRAAADATAADADLAANHDAQAEALEVTFEALKAELKSVHSDAERSMKRRHRAEYANRKEA